MAELEIDVLSTNLIRSGYQALRRGDEQPLGSLLEEDIEWRQARRGLFRRRVLLRGRNDVVQAFRTMIAKGELSDPYGWNLHDVLLVGDLAAVTFSWTTPAATTAHLAHVVRLSAGRVIAIRNYASHRKALPHERPTAQSE